MMRTSTDFDHTLKITLIGDASVGKSSILLKYIDDVFEDGYLCTIGVDFKIKALSCRGKSVKLHVWDTAGQERFHPLTKCYFRESQGGLVVFDITHNESIGHAKE